MLTAALALAAAGASWASVLQSRKQIRASLEPDIQTVIEGCQGNPHLGLEIRNTGGGTAKRLAFIASIGSDAKTAGRLGVGYLPPGHGVNIIIDYQGQDLDDGDVAVVLIAADTREFAHAWSYLGKHKVFRSRFRRRPHTISLGDAFRHFFSDIDLEGRRQVGFKWRVIPPEDMYRSRSEMHAEIEDLRN